MRRFFQFDPLTRKRFQRFRRIKRGYYSLIILLALIIISMFADFIANDRALIVKYEGSYYFPTFTYYPMHTFGQTDEWGFEDAEPNYRNLKQEFRGSRNWVLMPPIPFGPLGNDFGHYDFPPPHPPDSRHLLGTDSQARDVFARLLYGFRISIFFSFGLVIASQIIGVIIGSLQGYLGGRFDLFSQRFVEIWSCLPFLYVVILLATFFAPNFWLLIGVLALFQWIGITYYMRTEMYREKSREYCLAARAMGASHSRIIFKHLLPNCLTPLVTLVPFMIVGGIFSLTALDFLGFGLPPPTPSWGELIDQSMSSANRGKLWMVLSPFGAITITLLLVTLIGESVREAFDPRQYSRYQ